MNDYHAVDMVPIPGKPSWHQQSTPVSYTFPSYESAHLFAHTHRQLEPARVITVRKV